jgi:hypothetical protein
METNDRNEIARLREMDEFLAAFEAGSFGYF